jgi:hypothetical protein
MDMGPSEFLSAVVVKGVVAFSLLAKPLFLSPESNDLYWFWYG